MKIHQKLIAFAIGIILSFVIVAIVMCLNFSQEQIIYYTLLLGFGCWFFLMILPFFLIALLKYIRRSRNDQ